MAESNSKNGDEVSTGELARMINTGFNDVKSDIGKINVRMDAMGGRLDGMDARLGRIEADISGLREEIVYRHEFEDALDRIKYIERKLGIESGV